MWPNHQFGTLLKKKVSTGEINNNKRPGRPRKTIKVNDCRNLCLIKTKASQHQQKSKIL